jgi:Ca2+:H+ antiporter
MLPPDAPEAFHDAERDLAERRAEINSWICVGMLVLTIAIMAVTAEFLVESIEVIRSNGHITQEYVNKFS